MLNAEEKSPGGFTELVQFELEREAVQRLDLKFCLENGVVVLQNAGRGRLRPVVGLLEPGNEKLVHDVERRLKGSFRAVQLNDYEVRRAIAFGFGQEEGPRGETGMDLQLVEPQTIQFERDQPPAKIVDAMLATAIRMGASDLHVEIYRHDVDLRFRIDGVLNQVTTPLNPENIRSVVTRIKVLALLDIAEHRMPQDGRIQVVYHQGEMSRKVDLRVSVLPGPFGENVVFRILDGQSVITRIDALGLDSQRLERVMECLRTLEGMMLVTGPAGSGKTTTLYACLRQIASPEIKILTVEDPIEYEISKVCQHQVNVKLGFADYARSFMRQDPNVLMIGEIRDEETAGLALRAAMTGHLVLSTLHCADAVSAVARLIDLGLSPAALAETLRVVVAQRLVRKVCPKCGGKALHPPSQIPVAARSPAQPRACAACHGIGFSGRTGLFEVLFPDPRVREMILANVPGSTIRDQLGPSLRSMADDAREKIAAGITTEAEAKRVIPVLTPSSPVADSISKNPVSLG